jgi:hypothetical protein
LVETQVSPSLSRFINLGIQKRYNSHYPSGHPEQNIQRISEMECDLADQPYSFCFINGNYEAKAGKMAY